MYISILQVDIQGVTRSRSSTVNIQHTPGRPSGGLLGVEAGRFIYQHTPGRHSGGLLGVEAGRFIYQHSPGTHSRGLLGVEAGRLIYQLILPGVHSRQVIYQHDSR